VALWLSCLGAYSLATLVFVFGRTMLPTGIVRYIDGAWYRGGELAVILGLATLMMLAGLLTDLFEPGWRVRLGVQVLAAVALAAFGARVTLFWPFTYPVVGGLVTVLWVVGLVNAFAFLDNMDGLATGIGLIAALLFTLTQVQVGSLFAPAALLILVGSLGGILIFNRYPARLFLGFSGSWFLGFLLAAMTIAGTYYRYGRQESPNSVLAPLLVMAVPFYESAVVFLIWLSERDQPFLYNPRHFSYRLQEVGLSPGQSVWLLMLVSLGAGLGALLLRRLDALGTMVLLGQTACLIAVVALVELTAIRRKRVRRL
jgi:UDP-GlcNAc:undecaprenyl-phosphate GlcNAc-1-phosphate transferase